MKVVLCFRQVVENLAEVVHLTPSGLVEQFLSTLWVKVTRGDSHKDGYARPVRLLEALAKGAARQAAAPLTGAESFLCSQVRPFITSPPFTRDLLDFLAGSEAEDEATPLSLLERLALLLRALSRGGQGGGQGRSSDLLEAFRGASDGSGGNEALPLQLLTTLLVGQGALPLSALSGLRASLLSPAGNTATGTSVALALLPFLAGPLLALATSSTSKAGLAQVQALQREWVLALLDYLQVAPHQPRPLAMLAFLVSGWYPAQTLALAEDVREDWRAARAYFQRVEADPALCRLSADDCLRFEVLPGSAAKLLVRLGLEGETEVMARAVRVLSVLDGQSRGQSQGAVAAWRTALDEESPLPRGQGLVRWSMMMILAAGTTAGRALERGALPMVKVLIGKWAIAAALGGGN